jgi:hypothetical protein
MDLDRRAGQAGVSPAAQRIVSTRSDAVKKKVTPAQIVTLGSKSFGRGYLDGIFIHRRKRDLNSSTWMGFKSIDLDDKWDFLKSIDLD